MTPKMTPKMTSKMTSKMMTDLAFLVELSERYKSDLNTLNASWRRNQERLEQDFRVRWFIHRAVIPVSVVSGVPSNKILSNIRRRDIFHARALTTWIAYRTGDLSYAHVGRVMGRDHSTVRHAVHMVDDEIESGAGSVYLMLRDVCELERQWH